MSFCRKVGSKTKAYTITHKEDSSDKAFYFARKGLKPVIERTVLTSSGSFDFPNDMVGLKVTIVGGGASGGGGYAYHGNVFNGGGGGSGAKVVKTYSALEIENLKGTTINYTVGAGGAGVSVYNDGKSGGTTTFGTMIAYGGSGGHSGVGPSGGAGGTGTGGTVTNGNAGGSWTSPSGGKGFEVSGVVYGSGSNGTQSSTNDGTGGCIYILIKYLEPANIYY